MHGLRNRIKSMCNELIFMELPKQIYLHSKRIEYKKRCNHTQLLTNYIKLSVGALELAVFTTIKLKGILYY